MRVGINLLYLRPGKVGGSEIYIRELIKELSKLPNTHIILFCGAEAAKTFSSSENLVIVPVFDHSFNQMRRLFAENISLKKYCKIYKIDILFSPANFGAPLLQGKIPQVVTVHDLQHKYLKSYFSKAKYLQREILFRLSLAKAKKIIAISNYTKQGILNEYNVSPNQIRTIYEGIADKIPLNNLYLNNIKAKFGLDNSFFFYPAMLAPHKNHPMLLHAFSNFLRMSCDNNCFLLFSGYKDPRWETIQEISRSLGISDRVFHLGYLSRKELFGVMTLATAMVFPSKFEGFGLPILEAMQCGTPVIASDCTSIPDVAGEAAQLINPEDIKGWAKAMFCSYTDKNIRTRYKTKGEQNLLRFSWEKCARETMDVFNEVFSLSKTQKEGNIPICQDSCRLP